jgi:hypothetical protein
LNLFIQNCIRVLTFQSHCLLCCLHQTNCWFFIHNQLIMELLRYMIVEMNNQLIMELLRYMIVEMNNQLIMELNSPASQRGAARESRGAQRNHQSSRQLPSYMTCVITWEQGVEETRREQSVFIGTWESERQKILSLVHGREESGLEGVKVGPDQFR